VPTALADFLATHSDVDVELQERPSAADAINVPSEPSDRMKGYKQKSAL
jgi:hypothetical protein